MTREEAIAAARARWQAQGYAPAAAAGGGAQPAGQPAGKLTREQAIRQAQERRAPGLIAEARAKRKAAAQQALYEALPWYSKAAVAGQDIAGVMGDVATLGYGDKAVAAARSKMLGTSYEDELAKARAQTNAAYERSGSAGVAAGLGSALATLPETGALKAAPYIGKGIGWAAERALPRAALYGAEGAAYGAGSAAGHDQDIGTGALVGGALGAGGSAIGDVLGKAVPAAAREAPGMARSALDVAKRELPGAALAAAGGAASSLLTGQDPLTSALGGVGARYGGKSLLREILKERGAAMPAATGATRAAPAYANFPVTRDTLAALAARLGTLGGGQ
jgi:hypothetical protein